MTPSAGGSAKGIFPAGLPWTTICGGSADDHCGGELRHPRRVDRGPGQCVCKPRRPAKGFVGPGVHALHAAQLDPRGRDAPTDADTEETPGGQDTARFPQDSSAALTREKIVKAAVRIVDRDGLAALSMRRLGAALGVDPMAIYYHLPNKAAL